MIGNPEIDRILGTITDQYGYMVLGGPFQGMKYVRESDYALIPKLIGCYEEELSDVFSTHILVTPYDKIINIGSAEGYYAVGLALRNHTSQIYAFDINPYYQELCRQMSLMNQVQDRINIFGICDPAHLNQLTQDGRVLIVCDIEGGELNLLLPNIVPNLSRCDILVEMHDVYNPAITPTILPLFSKSHQIEVIYSRQRNPAVYPVLYELTPREREIAVQEWRPGVMSWAFMKPFVSST